MTIKRTPQAAPLLTSWLPHLENLYSKTIDLGLKRVSQVTVRLGVLRPVPPAFIVAGTNSRGITCRTLGSTLMAAGCKMGVYSPPYLVRYTERVRVQGQELPESAHTASLAEIESARGDISLTYFEYGTPSMLWLFKQVQFDVVILEARLGGHLDVTNIVDVDIAAVTGITLDHIDWLGPDCKSIGREKAGIFRSEKPVIVGEPEMSSTIADVAQEKDALLQRRDVKQNYSVTGHDWTFSGAYGTLENLPLSLVPQPGAATALTALHASGSEVNKNVIRDGTASTILPRRFQIVSGSPRATSDVAHNLHVAECLIGRMKALPENRCVLAIIGIPHDRNIAGTLAWLKGVIDDWYYVSLEGSCGITAEQLFEHSGNGKSFGSVAQVWGAVMTDAKVEDAVLVCGSFYAAAHVTEVIDAGRSGGK